MPAVLSLILPNLFGLAAKFAGVRVWIVRIAALLYGPPRLCNDDDDDDDDDYDDGDDGDADDLLLMMIATWPEISDRTRCVHEHVKTVLN